MRILVVADVHANLEAFEAVLAQAGSFDAIWSLGDIVGYGPDPVACMELLQRYSHVAIAGNHDLAAAEGIGLEDFNPFAAAAVRWTVGQLNPTEKVWLLGLPQVVVGDQDFTLVHGSLRDPIWGYLFTEPEAAEHLGAQETSYSLVGHTHVPMAFSHSSQERLADGASLALGGSRFVANPGSVGQPRDGDPRAAYAVIDTDARRIDFHRVAYDVAATQAKMRRARLPEYLAERLARGR